MDDEAVATAIASLDTKMDVVLTAINDIKLNCVRTETSRGEDIKDLYEKISKLGAGLYKITNGLAIKAENHTSRLDAHDRYFGYVAAVLIGIIIAVAAAIIAKG
jgi:hypothetical protein